MSPRRTPDRGAVAVLAALAMLAPVVGVVVGSGVASAVSSHPATQTFRHDGHFAVPAEVDSITVTVVGGGGGAAHELVALPSAGGQAQTYPGGPGRTVHATLDVSDLGGQTLDVIVGTAGRSGLIETGSGGIGYGDGGDGGTDGTGLHGNDVLGFGGGGGGGASAVLSGSMPLVVAGGGGGGGARPLVLGTPLNYLGGSGCGWQAVTAPSGAATGPTPPCPIAGAVPGSFAPPPAPPLPDACTASPDPTGHDGGDGANQAMDGDLAISTGGGGGGGWVGGTGGRPAGRMMSPADPPGAIDSCTGDGVAGTDHVAADGVSAVTRSSAGTSGVDGSVTITFTEPDTTIQGTQMDSSTSTTAVSTTSTSTTAASSTTPPTTAVAATSNSVPVPSATPTTTGALPTTDPPTSAPAATAVEATPRYTG